ncbi:MAG: threonylcarbamoyl-AMP synthase [Bacteroidetes bacterium]|uniref:Threonylcarbamoyl-AMP synthase n=1 Tax=Candidatus Cryptobacteroides merdigallinarum TaxID=2840770 RepID=A0A9D9EJN7_9BACT|nr:threonylcarbamoyl-AMP synthase [Candidatus Cryptobacteroides merdigallinarum]
MVLRLYDRDNDPDRMKKVTDILDSGGIAIYPTDTMYAIGCHALKERAVEKICRIKGIDPKKNNLSIICYDLSEISRYARMDNATFKLMKRNLPGPFTFILDGTSRLPKIFRSRKEVGIRMPDNPVIREIARQLDAPIMTATIPYDESEDPGYATDPELIEEKWGGSVDLIIDGGPGGLGMSTVVDCTGPEFTITRQGDGNLIV